LRNQYEMTHNRGAKAIVSECYHQLRGDHSTYMLWVRGSVAAWRRLGTGSSSGKRQRLVASFENSLLSEPTSIPAAIYSWTWCCKYVTYTPSGLARIECSSDLNVAFGSTSWQTLLSPPQVATMNNHQWNKRIKWCCSWQLMADWFQ